MSHAQFRKSNTQLNTRDNKYHETRINIKCLSKHNQTLKKKFFFSVQIIGVTKLSG